MLGKEGRIVRSNDFGREAGTQNREDVLFYPLVGKEEERIVPGDGTSEASPKLMTAEGTLVDIGELLLLGLGVEAPVAEELEDRPMKFVGPRFGDDGDGTTARRIRP